MQFTKETQRLAEAMAPLAGAPPLLPASRAFVRHFLAELERAAAAIQPLMPLAPVAVQPLPVGLFPMPTNFRRQHFPEEVWQHLQRGKSNVEIRFQCPVGPRTVEIVFVCEQRSQCQVAKLQASVQRILMWVWILNRTAALPRCARVLRVFLYWTKLKKQLPDNAALTLGQIHVNTAFTTSCPANAEIVIFRHEEWFKVLLHESFHSFALDFSDASLDVLHRCIRRLFPHLQSDMLLFESYTECWAELLNGLFCAYDRVVMQGNTGTGNTEALVEKLWNLEVKYSFFQMAKVLQHQGASSVASLLQPETQRRWRENSNVFAYYVVKTLLLSDVNVFLAWCAQHNGRGLADIFQFQKNQKTMLAFCRWIETRLQDPDVEARLSQATQLLQRTRKNAFLRKNLRMTLCEMG